MSKSQLKSMVFYWLVFALIIGLSFFDKKDFQRLRDSFTGKGTTNAVTVVSAPVVQPPATPSEVKAEASTAMKTDELPPAAQAETSVVAKVDEPLPAASQPEASSVANVKEPEAVQSERHTDSTNRLDHEEVIPVPTTLDELLTDLDVRQLQRAKRLEEVSQLTNVVERIATNWVEAVTTNVVQVFETNVVERGANWVNAVSTNVVQLIEPSTIQIFETNVIERVMTNWVDVVSTNVVQMYATNVVMTVHTNVVDYYVPNLVTVVSTNFIDVVRTSWTTNYVDRERWVTNYIDVVTTDLKTNYVDVVRTNWVTVAVTNDVGRERMADRTERARTSMVSFADTDRHLPLAGRCSLTVKTVNVTNLECRVSRILRSNFVHLLAREEMRYRSFREGGGSTRDMQELATGPVVRTFKIQANPGETVYLDLPLDDRDGVFYSGVYLVSARDMADPDECHAAYRIVCVTDIELSVRQIGGKVFVKTQLIALGKPIVGAHVTIYGVNNARLGEWVSDAEGRCRCDVSRRGVPFAVIATTRNGRDMCFLALPKSDKSASAGKSHGAQAVAEVRLSKDRPFAPRGWEGFRFDESARLSTIRLESVDAMSQTILERRPLRPYFIGVELPAMVRQAAESRVCRVVAVGPKGVPYRGSVKLRVRVRGADQVWKDMDLHLENGLGKISIPVGAVGDGSVTLLDEGTGERVDLNYRVVRAN